jgi:hypothetical protein
VAIAAAALTIVSIYQISTVNKIISEQCSTFSDEKLRQQCISDALDKLPSIDFSAISGQLFKWLVIGGLVAGGVIFMPTVARSLLKTRKELKG